MDILAGSNAQTGESRRYHQAMIDREDAFTESLRLRNIAISMDGKGRWMDNVFIERLWKSVKYEDIYLKAYGSMAEVKKGLGAYFS